MPLGPTLLPGAQVSHLEGDTDFTITLFKKRNLLSCYWRVTMLPVSASTVKRSTLGPSRRYFTTALRPMSLSSARTGPFKTVTVVPTRQTEMSGMRKKLSSQFKSICGKKKSHLNYYTLKIIHVKFFAFLL